MSHSPQKATLLKAYCILIFLSFVWGSSFILIKKALIAFDPVEVACLRLSISSLAFAPLLVWQFKEVDWRKWKAFLAVGLTGSGVPAFMYATAQTEISSTMSGVLNSLTPIFTLIVSILIYKNPFNPSKVQGVVLGFAGAAMLFVLGDSGSKGSNQWYGLFVVMGTFCYGFSSNIVQHNLQGIRSLVISAVSFCLLGPPALAYLFTTDVIRDITTHEYGYQSLAAITFLALVGTVMASILFYYLVQVTDAVFSSTVAFIMPLVAILWGIFDGEIFLLTDLLGMMLILGGVYLIKRKKITNIELLEQKIKIK